MNDNIAQIKAKITAMLRERYEIYCGDPIRNPSDLWSFGASNFDYMLGLPDKDYAKLRLHTYHFTGDIHLNYWGDGADFRRANAHIADAPDIPLGYRINELPGGIGFHYPDGRFLSADSVRFQRVINTLYRNIVFPSGTVLEIGAGYGGLAHHLSNFFENTTKYVIVDLPETLLFSAAYLTMHNPEKDIYIYRAGDMSLPPRADFILIPNYRLDLLNKWEFSLVLNVASMQEMRTEQVETYLDFIQKHCTGVFYSLNLDCYKDNHELTSLSELLKARFNVREIPPPLPEASVAAANNRTRLLSILTSVARGVGLLDKPAAPAAPDTRYTYEHEYICKEALSCQYG